MTVSYLDADGVAPRAARAVAGRAQRPGDGRHRGRHHGGRVDGPGPARRRDRPGPRAAVRAAGRRSRPSATWPSSVVRGAGRGGRRGAVDDAAGVPGPQRRDRRRAPSATCGSSPSACQDPAAFVAEFVRLVELLPQEGLILDVRGNGGGHIFASEFTLQTLTPAPDHPGAGAVQLHAAEPGDLPAAQGQPDPPDRPRRRGSRRWTRRSRPGRSTRRRSRSRPEDGANAIGQRYFGPGRPGHRRPLLLRDRHLRRRLPGPRDRPGARRGRQHRRRRRQRLDPRPAQGAARPAAGRRDRRTRRCPGRPTCGWPSGARCASGKLAGTPVEDLGVRPTCGTR